MNDLDTKSRILDAAEALFAAKGVAGASLRELTREAGVNLAAVSYHFGSKDGLLRELVHQRFAPINEARLRLLDAAEAEASPAPVPVPILVRIFLQPAMERFADPAAPFPRLIGRLHLDPHPDLLAWMREIFEPTIERYLDAFQRSLPHLDRAEIFLRASFMLGSMIHVLCNTPHHKQVFAFTDDRLDRADWLLDQLVRYSAAGIAHE